MLLVKTVLVSKVLAMNLSLRILNPMALLNDIWHEPASSHTYVGDD